MKIVPESMKVDEPFAEVTREGRVIHTRLNYPAHNPRDCEYVEDEYADDQDE